MPRNTTVNAESATWTQLTDADVTEITFQNNSPDYVLISATVGATAPTSISGAIRYNPGQGERLAPLTDMYPGLTGANRLWVYAPNGAYVMVSHA